MLPENKKGLLVTGWKNNIYIQQTKTGYMFSDDYDEKEFLSYEKMKEYELKERDLADYARDWLGFDNINKPMQYEW